SMAKEYHNIDIEKVKLIKVIVTTSERNIRKKKTYRPNEAKENRSVKIVTVLLKNEEAHVYLNQLLK
ncbi:MAG: hypothetical protein ACKO5Q_13680, partial [Microcystaceae cyanobacterium]